MGDSFIHSRDVSRLLDLVEEAHVWAPDDIFPASVLDDLAVLVPADDITFQVIDVGERRGTGIEVSSGQRAVFGSPPPDDPFWGPDGCSGLAARHEHTGVVADIAENWDRWSSELIALLPLRNGLDRRLLLWRYDCTPYSDREVDLLRLLRPHIAELEDRRALELAGLPPLTRRQWAVLRLVAAGWTNARIGHHLGVAEGTVRKHLENAYERLEVASRAEAVGKVAAHL